MIRNIEVPCEGPWCVAKIRRVDHGTGRKRRYCSDACRQAAYRERRRRRWLSSKL